jgi:plastocyanin
VAHAASAPRGDFDATLAPNKSGTLVVQKAGTIRYSCRFQPNMKATLVVAP